MVNRSPRGGPHGKRTGTTTTTTGQSGSLPGTSESAPCRYDGGFADNCRMRALAGVEGGWGDVVAITFRAGAASSG